MKMEVRSGKNSLTRLIAGVIIFIFSILTLFHSPYWAILTAFMGITSIISSITGFCLMEKILYYVFGLPVKGKD